MTGIISGTGSIGDGQGSALSRTNRPVSVKGNQIQIKPDKAESLLAEYREQGVNLDLSGEQPAGKFSEEELAAMKEEAERRSIQEMYQENLESAKESAEAAGEGFKDMGRALEIARRMMHGDIVPASDEKFLMEYNKDIYMGAKTMQALAQNEDPEKYDSILEDEEGENATVTVEGGDITIDAANL